MTKQQHFHCNSISGVWGGYSVHKPYPYVGIREIVFDRPAQGKRNNVKWRAIAKTIESMEDHFEKGILTTTKE